MELIDKAAVIAEIKRRISNHNKELQHASAENFVSSWASDEENQKLALTALIPFLDTLEVKEVDLKKEKDDYWNKLCNSEFGELLERDAKWFDDIAKYFFELGLKVKKGE